MINFKYFVVKPNLLCSVRYAIYLPLTVYVYTKHRGLLFLTSPWLNESLPHSQISSAWSPPPFLQLDYTKLVHDTPGIPVTKGTHRTDVLHIFGHAVLLVLPQTLVVEHVEAGRQVLHVPGVPLDLHKMAVYIRKSLIFCNIILEAGPSWTRGASGSA
jgi:hypothetical protein